MGWALLCQSLIKKCTTAFPTVQSWSGIFLNQGPLLTDDYSLGQDNIKLASTERSGLHFWVFVWLTVQRDKVSHGGRHGTLRLATKVCSWPGSRQRWMLVFTFSFSIYDLRPGDATYIQVESLLPLSSSGSTCVHTSRGTLLRWF